MTYEQVKKKVQKGKFMYDHNVLRLANKDGRTIAHSQAFHGWVTEDSEVLKLAKHTGWTVAHNQAWNGWRTDNPEILKLITNGNWTVKQEQQDSNRWKKK